MDQAKHAIVFEIAKSIIVNCSYRRAFYDGDRCLNLVTDSSFSAVTAGAYFTQAILKWCVLFGTDDPEKNKYHWKNVLHPNQHEAFRSLLHSAYGNKRNWEHVHGNFVTARNQAIAHVHDGESRSILGQDQMLLAVKSLLDYLQKISGDTSINQFDYHKFKDEHVAKAAGVIHEGHKMSLTDLSAGALESINSKLLFIQYAGFVFTGA